MAFDYDVFLSYSTSDKKAVRALAKRLKKDGLNVWLDEWAIQPGAMIGKKISEGVEQSRTLLLCMSPAYFDSAWTTLEYQTLLFRDPTNEQLRFIPLLLADCTPPATIAQFAHIDWRTPSDKAYARLLDACRGEEEAETTETPAEEEEQVDQARMVLRGHNSVVDAVAITPDGERIISGSQDKTLKVWDLKSGRSIATLKGHSGMVTGLAITPDGKRVISGSQDKTLKVWDLKSGKSIATLKGHSEEVFRIAITPDGKKVVSASQDLTMKVWDLGTNQCIASFFKPENKNYQWPAELAITPDGKKIVTGIFGEDIDVWDLKSEQCLATFKGHMGRIPAIAITPEGEKVVSGSQDKTLKVWDLKSGRSIATFEGHAGEIRTCAITPDGKTIVSGSDDHTLKVWDLESGQCRATFEGHTSGLRTVAITPDGKTVISGSLDKTLRVWDLPEPALSVAAPDTTRYTNAKVVLVGESGAGKTGLALRLAEDRWEETASTHGMNVWPLKLPEIETPGMEREVWLWDFAGQPDYRLIHQLYMDETALALLVVDPQSDDPFEPLGHWEKALTVAVKRDPAKMLIAARCDRGGFTISQNKIDQHCNEQGYSTHLNTSAKTGDGCADLKTLIAKNIPWDRLPWTATSRLFKTLKDAIIGIKEEGIVLARISELRQRLQLELQDESFEETALRTVVGLLESQGIIKKLDFGDFVLLQPEQINNYASAVVRSAREHVDEIGAVPERDVLEAQIDFKDMDRLGEADETILLRAMLQTFLDRSLCVRQETDEGTQLVFPSYFKQDRPEIPEQPNVVVTYGFSGTLDEIYSTLVVRLHYTNDFKMDELWRYAADFTTQADKRVGLLMTKKKGSAAEMQVYFEGETSEDTQVSFIKYIHEHLKKHAEDVTRVRSYVCPHCDEPVENRRAIKIRLERGFSDIICGLCEERVPLIDLIETKFASDAFLRTVQEMDAQAQFNLDNESLELILFGHAYSTAGEAGQTFRPTPDAEWGLDGEIEFKNNQGQPSGRRLVLLLKPGVSVQRRRGVEGQDRFSIKNPSHAARWQVNDGPVMLVIRTSDGQIRWMNVTDYLREHGAATKQIVFDGEPFTALNVARMRDRVLQAHPQP